MVQGRTVPEVRGLDPIVVGLLAEQHQRLSDRRLGILGLQVRSRLGSRLGCPKKGVWTLVYFPGGCRSCVCIGLMIDRMSKQLSVIRNRFGSSADVCSFAKGARRATSGFRGRCGPGVSAGFVSTRYADRANFRPDPSKEAPFRSDVRRERPCKGLDGVYGDPALARDATGCIPAARQIEPAPSAPNVTPNRDRPTAWRATGMSPDRAVSGRNPAAPLEENMISSGSVPRPPPPMRTTASSSSTGSAFIVGGGSACSPSLIEWWGGAYRERERAPPRESEASESWPNSKRNKCPDLPPGERASSASSCSSKFHFLGGFCFGRSGGIRQVRPSARLAQNRPKLNQLWPSCCRNRPTSTKFGPS